MFIGGEGLPGVLLARQRDRHQLVGEDSRGECLLRPGLALHRERILLRSRDAVLRRYLLGGFAEEMVHSFFILGLVNRQPTVLSAIGGGVRFQGAPDLSMT